jgi:peptide/nickel transport system permease protein
MLTYLIRRVLHAIPILIGVNLLTFTLFFMVTTPDDMARVHLGGKYATPQSIAPPINRLIRLPAITHKAA